jgi:hypothetical protein
LSPKSAPKRTSATPLNVEFTPQGGFDQRSITGNAGDDASALPDGQISSPSNCGVSGAAGKNISLVPSGKSGALGCASRAERGALANVINAARDAVDAEALLDEQR